MIWKLECLLLRSTFWSKIMTTKKILINGQWVNGEDRIVEIRSPHNNELIANVSDASKSQMEEALETASSSFKIVKDLPAHLISNALLTIRDFIKDNSVVYDEKNYHDFFDLLSGPQNNLTTYLQYLSNFLIHQINHEV